MARHYWKWQDISLRWFHPNEFQHPELMDQDFLFSLDELRTRCGFALYVNNDGRTQEEHEDIYAPEDPPVSAHPEGLAIDFDLTKMTGSQRVQFVYHATKLCREGELPHLGLEICDQHVHVEDFDHPIFQRPTVWAGVSR